ncbi:MAG TPA: pseudouridine synthase [Sandaracinaceae bacterium]
MCADAPLAIAHEDRDLLVVIKPAGLPTTAPDGGDCLARRLQSARGAPLHPSSRLDAEVTGLVTFAKTKRAIEALSRARREGRYGRGYLGIATRAPEPRAGRWEASIAIDPRDPRLRIALAPGEKGARMQRAATTYAVREVTPHGALLWLTPHTGRTHQLRVHAAHAGAPLFGDHRYGGEKRIVLEDGRVVAARRVMLHCAWLSLPAVATRGTLELEAAPPPDLRDAWIALGGSEAALAPRPAP